MKKLFSLVIICALALMFSVSAYAADASLTDVNPGDWYYDEVSEMVAAGYIDGYEDGTFGPDRTVTVAEFVTMAARMTGSDTGSTGEHWAGIQMDNAYRSGWINEGDVARGEYDVAVTRELACKIIASVLSLGYPAGTVLPFTDSDEIGEAYSGSVMALYASGLLDGYEDGTLRPDDTLTRAQAAVLLYRASHAGDESEAPEPSITAAGYTAEEIVNYFCDVALGAEYGDSVDNVIKWTEPIYYSVDGEATEADMQQFTNLVAALNRISGIPGIYEAGEGQEPNLKIHFVSTDTMVSVCGDQYNGFVNIWWSGFVINRGEIYYNTDIAQDMRTGVIAEELCQGLGLLTDTYDHPESIFYQYHTDASWPTTLDWAVIQLLYSDAITPGMDESAVRSAASALVG